MFAIRAERDFVCEEDFMKAVRKVRRLARATPPRQPRRTQTLTRVASACGARGTAVFAQVAENKKLEGTLSYSKV